MESIILGGGCFWCLDTLYRSVKGITSVVCGYAGGADTNPTYQKVSYGDTGHAEVVHITFDPKIISLKKILEVFWSIHDPTTPNRQGADVGPQYRSIALYTSQEQKQQLEATRDDMQQYWEVPIITEIISLTEFYPAEDYHQNYFANNPDQAYCQLVINPKIAHFKQQFANLLA